METTNSNPDRILAQRAADGDESAWREIYQSTRERLFGLLVYQVGDRDEAKELLQDTYLHAVKGIGRYEGRAPLESWLVGIAIRRALDWKRRLLGRFKRTTELDALPELEEAVPQPDPEEGRRLRRALAELPDRQRTAVLLHEWMGYAFAEIGEHLGISEATARVHAHRGREALRRHLSDDGAEDLLDTAPARIREERT